MVFPSHPGATSPNITSEKFSKFTDQLISSLHLVKEHFAISLATPVIQGLKFLEQSKISLLGALDDNVIEEHELLHSRVILLQAISIFHSMTHHAGRHMEQRIRLINALRGITDCFIEHEIVLKPNTEQEQNLQSIISRKYLIGEFCLETFEVKSQMLWEILHEFLQIEKIEENIDAKERGVNVQEHEEQNLIATTIIYLKTIVEYGIPGAIYGEQTKKNNPFVLSRLIRIQCNRLNHVLKTQPTLKVPLNRLSRLESQLTRFIEEIRTSGTPFEESNRLFRRYKPSKLDEIRIICQEISEIEEIIKEKQLA